MPHSQFRATPKSLAMAAGVVAAIALFLGLGVWQVQRLAWKTDLIQRVDARVHAPVITAPGQPAWGHITQVQDEYCHVTVHGHFLPNETSQVYALTDYGAGYWVMTPLSQDDSTIIYINRGFIPQTPATTVATPSGEVTVTGLLRISETKGWLFSQANDPTHDLWYHRDIATMAHKHHLSPVAPYFIDADATPNPGGWPKGGLTVVQFPNSHLVYALTWFSLAVLLAGVSIWLTWFRKVEAEEA